MGAEARQPRLPPPWLGNLLVFGLLFAMVLGWFFLQTRQAEQAFREDAAGHARLLADAVALHARGAVLAQGVTDSILTAFLGNSARFVDYLDGIEAFRAEELTAFAAEAGLSLIRIQLGADMVQGPASTAGLDGLDCTVRQRLIRRPEAHQVLYAVAREGRPGCVMVGMDSRRIEALRRTVGLPRALQAVAALPGIEGVGLDGEPRLEDDGSGAGPAAPAIRLRRDAAGRVLAEARVPLLGTHLTLQMDAGPLVLQRDRLWLQFTGFAAVLIVAGGLGTWLLYRRQQAHDRQLRDYEQRLSRQREEAALGRAAASIAHEIRNPLNAMAMGLQRLQLEAGELDAGHRRLVDVVLQALRRTDGSVNGLLDYARQYRPDPRALDMSDLLRQQLSLYDGALRQAGVELHPELPPACPVAADKALLVRVLDNLLRNALEAGPRRLEIRLAATATEVRLRFANDGLVPDVGDLAALLQPWVTTKAEGTGLGLAISRRIVAAHGGELTLQQPQPGWLAVELVLPRRSLNDQTAAPDPMDTTA